MAHWIRLPDGGYVNTDTLSGIGPQMPLLKSHDQGYYRSYSTQAGFSGRIENLAADILVADIAAQIGRQGPLPVVTGPEAEAEAVMRWIPGAAPAAPALPDVAPLGSRDEFPGIRQLDLRLGDDVLSLRYGGVDYVAAIKLRFGDAPEGLGSCYLEVSYHNPHTAMWTLIERHGVAAGVREYCFSSVLPTILDHDRAQALGE